MNTNRRLSRRGFLRLSATAGGGLLLSLSIPACSPSSEDTPNPTHLPTEELPPTATPDPDSRFEPSAFVRIDGSGLVTLTIPRPDVGQGGRTAVAMILAEELSVKWDRVRVEQAPADRRFGDQHTGGSSGISDLFTLMQRTGALARTLLITAAAQRWEVPPDACAAEDGMVIHEDSGRQFSYGDVAAEAAELPLPRMSDVKFKDPSTYSIIGSRIKRVDAEEMVTGRSEYALDTTIPGMRYAVLARSPVPGGRIAEYDRASAMAVEGVVDVIEVSNGVAVVGDSTWAAINGRQALQVSWDEGDNAGLSTDSLRQAMLARILPDDWSGTSPDPDELAAVYEVPHLAHATQEPPSCVIDLRADRCEVWAPTQRPAEAKARIKSITRLADDAVTVHIPIIGGGFGRRLSIDFIEEAVEIAVAAQEPLKLVWTREDDIRHDRYHPFSVHFAQASLSRPALPRVTSQTDHLVPSGYWRSVSNFTDAFVRECFLDEIAAALGRDPLELRLDLHPPMFHPVLQEAADKAGWGTPLPEGWGRGIACHATWNVSPVAIVAEVEAMPGAPVRVHRMVCAIDCGLVINPNMVEEQMEGGIVYGLSAALKSSITLADGRIEQRNFDDYPILTMPEMPRIEVHILPSNAPPSGVGEMSTPPSIPAVFNAVFDATGERFRQMPLKV